MTHRVLIVEDEKPLREAFAFLLETEGYSISLAENGQAGLELLKSFKPDLVLLDMLMPVMNGLEFLKAAKEKLRRKSGPKVLLLSNLSDPITIENAHVYGVDKMILKADLSPAELAGVVKEMLLTK